GKRYFLDHEYFIFKQQDSLKNYGLSVGHQLTYETKSYEFRQEAANAYFGESYQTSKLHDKSKLRTFNNLLSLNYQNKIIGKASFLANSYKYNYFFNSIVVGPESTITNQLRDNEIALGGRWEKTIGGFSLKGSLMQNIVGEMGGTQLNAQMGYQLNDEIHLGASIHASTRM